MSSSGETITARGPRGGQALDVRGLATKVRSPGPASSIPARAGPRRRRRRAACSRARGQLAEDHPARAPRRLGAGAGRAATALRRAGC